MSATPPDGFRLLGRELQVQRMVGSGGFGDVLLVVRVRAEANPRHGFTFPPQCVVKVMRAGLCGQRELEQAQREVRVLKSLSHPNIVRYIGSWIELSRGPHHNRFCLALQYCEGGDLADVVRRCTETKRMLPADVVVRLMAQVFSALNYSHSRHLIHRDIKPGNVLLTHFGNGAVGDAVVGDYGLVRSLDVTKEAVATRVGTPSYVSPEIVAGETYTTKTDIFSAGTMFYELMTLSRPFWRRGISEHQLFTAVLQYDPMPRFVRLVGDMYGAAMAEVLAACLAKMEKERATAYDVLVRIASPVSAYVRSNAVPVYVEKLPTAPPAARASPPSASASASASPERVEVPPPPTELAAAAKPNGKEHDERLTVRQKLNALFLSSSGSSAAAQLAAMLSHSPELLFQIRVLVACRSNNPKSLQRGVRDLFEVYGYASDPATVTAVTTYVMRNYTSLIN